MTPDDTLTTSPMLFGYAGRNGRLAALDALGGQRFRLGGGRAAEILSAFLEPRTVASAEADGFTSEELDQARSAGLLVPAAEAESIGLWERSGWSRPAFLLFSQRDIGYAEFPDERGEDHVPAAARREAVVAYGEESPYPEPGLLARGPASDLPAPLETSLPLAALTTRRSVRRFSESPPHAEEMAGVLHGATRGARVMASDRSGPDPLRLLNSFYSWAHLFVVVQDVDGVRPGVYEYDFREHRLVEAAPAPPEEAVLAAAHGQRWALGTGFAVFVVAELRGFAWLYRHSRAYLHLLTQVGALGQELLTAATELGLGGWTSPAIHESRSAELLGLPEDDAVEVLSIVKLGLPGS